MINSTILLFVTLYQVYGGQPEFDRRAEMARRMGSIKTGDTLAAVSQIVGTPTYTRQGPRVEFFDSHVHQSWHFCSRPEVSFPDLGSIYFDVSQRVMYVFGQGTPSPRLRQIGDELPSLLQRLNSMAGFCGLSFKAEPLLQLCSRLKELGFASTIDVLDEYVRVRPVVTTEPKFGTQVLMKPTLDGNDGRLAVVLYTLSGGHLSIKERPFSEAWYLGYRKLLFRSHDAVGPIMLFKNWPVMIAQGVVPTGHSDGERSLYSEFKGMKRIDFSPPDRSADLKSLKKELSAFLLRECVDSRTAHVIVDQILSQLPSSDRQDGGALR